MKLLMLPVALVLGGIQIALDHVFVAPEIVSGLLRDERGAHHGESISEDEARREDGKAWWV